jgi:hypothetical protein
LMDPGIVEDEDTQRAGVSSALGHLQRVSAGKMKEKGWHPRGCVRASREM